MSAPGPSVRRDCQCPRAQHQHGTKGGYDADGCRCAECRLAHRQDRAQRRRLIAYGRWDPFVAAQATSLRIKALHVAGWSVAEVGRQLGVTSTRVIQLREQRHPFIQRGPAAKVSAMYDRLWNVAPPARNQYEAAAVTRIRAMAKQRGWLPPLALDDDTIEDIGYNNPQFRYARGIPSDIDEIAVERAMRGDRVGLTKAERSEAFARLNRMGYSAREIGELLGVTGRTIVRKRSAAA